ncbi:hypothetical protein E2P86_08715 [Sphingobacterium psychroaquaticum]|uniref:hypothetical protein n=1 Tax=Sphingobacterium psychroaquaticum TaxID=561061 RepID=UPI00106AF6E7|nr:hypothetical protein [Sphingobacterium psychroaquaticum]QBQ41235.1 hypothetical protein E2P86_08715 [Sphingobacterium psychroaquaticum]
MKNTNYHCSSCSNGVVTISITESSIAKRVKVSDCNVCSKEYGLKGSAALVKVGGIHEKACVEYPTIEHTPSATGISNEAQLNQPHPQLTLF